MATREDILIALRRVIDPSSGRDLSSQGFVKKIDLEGDRVVIQLDLSVHPQQKDKLEAEIVRNVRQSMPEAKRVEIAFNAAPATRMPKPAAQGDLLPTVKRVLLVGSGKGGVGKSTVAANLACALQRQGHKVGLLDADIYGPSVPTMFGTHERPKMAAGGNKLSPIEAYGLELMSIGFLIDQEEAVVWRGPMLAGAIQQFMRDVAWSELDYLVVDLPPGTGDVQLTLSQQMKVTGALIVTTPQSVALADVVRAKSMFDKVHIPVIGLVENMSRFICTGCNEEHDIFDRGGGQKAALAMGIPFVGDIPIVKDVRAAGDAGMPIVARHPESPVSQAFMALATTVKEKLETAASEKSTFKIVA